MKLTRIVLLVVLGLSVAVAEFESFDTGSSEDDDDDDIELLGDYVRQELSELEDEDSTLRVYLEDLLEGLVDDDEDSSSGSTSRSTKGSASRSASGSDKSASASTKGSTKSTRSGSGKSTRAGSAKTKSKGYRLFEGKSEKPEETGTRHLRRRLGSKSSSRSYRRYRYYGGPRVRYYGGGGKGRCIRRNRRGRCIERVGTRYGYRGCKRTRGGYCKLNSRQKRARQRARRRYRDRYYDTRRRRRRRRRDFFDD